MPFLVLSFLLFVNGIVETAVHTENSGFKFQHWQTCPKAQNYHDIHAHAVAPLNLATMVEKIKNPNFSPQWL